MEFEKVYTAYFKSVYHYIWQLSGSDQLAEELTSETFFKAMGAIDRFRGDCDLRVWLCQIAKTPISHIAGGTKSFPAWTLRIFLRLPPGSRLWRTGWLNRKMPGGSARSFTTFPTHTRRSFCGGCSGNCPSGRSANFSTKPTTGPA